MNLMCNFLQFTRLFLFGVIIIIICGGRIALVVNVPQVTVVNTQAHLLLIRENKFSLHIEDKTNK